MAESAEGEAVVTAIGAELSRWREQLATIPDGSGFDRQRSLLSAWIKEGQRLVDNIG